MLSNEWVTHKKLLDAGGLGPVVYYIPARGGSRLSDAYRVLGLVSGGRTVVYERPGGKRQTISRVDGIIDYDILTPDRLERAERILNEFYAFLKGERNGTEKDV